MRLLIDSQGLAPDPEAGRKVVGEIVLAMRLDLLRSSNLDYRSFQYADVTDKKSIETCRPQRLG